MRQRSLAKWLTMLALTMSACGGGKNANAVNGANAANGTTLPWPTPFIETGYAQEEVEALATALREEHAMSIPAAMRDQLSDQVATAVAGAPNGLTVAPQTEAEAWVMSGVSATLQGSLDVAAWSYANAVLADPTDERALNQLGWALLALERVDEATGVLLHATQREERLWTLWSNLGYAAEVRGEPQRAVYYLGRSLEYHPESLHTHLRLGGLLLEQGDLVAASAHAAQALAISPTDAEVEGFADEVRAAGGDTATATDAPMPSGDAARAVRRDFDDCVTDATRRYSEALGPYVEHLLEDDQAYELEFAEAQSALPGCEAACDPSSDACFDNCLASFCATATAVEVNNYLRHLEVANVDMSLSAALRGRIRACGYLAVEARSNAVSLEFAEGFAAYVDGLCEVMAEGARDAFVDELADIERRLPVASECPGASSIPAETLSLLARLGISVSEEVCLDGFVCYSYTADSFEASFGIGVLETGLALDFRNLDVSWSVGTGIDSPIGAAGLSYKLSYRNGVGVSPSIKLGGVVRNSYSRDFWLSSY